MKEPLLEAMAPSAVDEADRERETVNPLSSAGGENRWGTTFQEAPASSKVLLPDTIHIFPTSYNTHNKTKQMHAGESLDFEPIHSEVRQLNQTRKLVHKKFYGYTGTTLVKYFVTIGTGLLTGCCAYGIAQSSSWLVGTRLRLAEDALNKDGLPYGLRLRPVIVLL